MPDLHRGIHKDFYSFEPGPGAEVHILKIEAVSFIHSSQPAKHIRAHQPKHTGCPIRMDQTIPIRVKWLKFVAWQSSPDNFKGSGQCAERVLDRSICIYYVGGNDGTWMRF